MAYNYAPAYYSSFRDTVSNLCRSLLPFQGRSILAGDGGEARQRADALKWQQESFHRILHLAALQREGIVPESEVRDFRSKMLAALAAAGSPAHPPSAGLLRDKLLFLQELLYSKCISAEEFESTKKPLLRQLADLGANVDLRGITAGDALLKNTEDEGEEEWSEIDLRDSPRSRAKEKQKKSSSFKSIMPKKWKCSNAVSNPGKPLLVDENAASPSVLMTAESFNAHGSGNQAKGKKRRPFSALFSKEEKNDNPNKSAAVNEGKNKGSWGFDGLKKWKKSSNGEKEEEEEEEDAWLAHRERSDSAPSVKNKINHSNDEVLGKETKKELSRIKLELRTVTASFSSEPVKEVPAKLPANNSELSNSFLPKDRCDQHGGVVLDATKTEFRGRVGGMEKQRNAARSEFEEETAALRDSQQSFYPNLFSHQKQNPISENWYHNSNPFSDENHISSP